MKTNVKKKTGERVFPPHCKKEKKIHVSWQKNVKMEGKAFGGVKNVTC